MRPFQKSPVPEVKRSQETQVQVTNESNDKSKLSCKAKFKQFSTNLIDHTMVISIMMIVTLWVLFSDDVRQIISNVKYDSYFYYVVLVCFGLFFVEIVLTFYAKDDYRWSFFFYLDAISTLTLLLDVVWVSNEIFGDESAGANAKSAASFAKTARASRIGTRASRLVRIIRLIRLVRVVKLYKGGKQAEVKNADSRKMKRSKSKKRGLENPSNNHLGVGSLRIPDGSNMSNDNSPEPSPRQAKGARDAARKSVQPSSYGDMQPNGSGALSKKSRDLSEPPSNSSKIESDLDAKEFGQDFIREIDDEIRIEDLLKETNVGKQLSDLTTKRVIILILSIMISIPILTIDTYWPEYSSYQSGLQNLSYMLKKNGNIRENSMFLKGWKSYVDIHTSADSSDTLRKLTVVRKDQDENKDNIDFTEDVLRLTNTTDKLDVKDEIVSMLRDYEKKTILDPYDVDSLAAGEFSIIAIFDVSGDFDLNSYLNIGRTVFVCLVLTASAVFFSKDANDLVLDPIENMLKKVRRIAKNPLKAARIEEEESLFWEDLQKKGKVKKGVKGNENYETTILEKTIVKIGALLALGFGEAGSEIIAKNMQKDGEIDPMVPGKKVVAIFGFCDIRNFTDVTEVLQEGVDSSDGR
jgi:hypothetical protein